MFRVALRWYWLTSIFIKKYFWGLFLGVIIGSLIFVKLPKLIKFIPIRQTTNVGRVGLFTLEQLPNDIQEKVSRGLTRILPDDTPELDIAQSLSISDDGLTYAFTLKPNIYWGNGDRLVSQDIDLNFPDIKVTYPTDESIVFSLEEPFAPFLHIVSLPLIKRVNSGLFKRPVLIGTNQFRLTHLKIKANIVRSLSLESSTEKIEYTFYATEDEAVTAFKLGAIDTIERLTTNPLQNWHQLTLETNLDPHRYLGLFYNTADTNLQDKSIRQLLTYSIIKPTDNRRALSPIAKTSWAYNPQVKPYLYNLETARSMLEKIKTANPNFQLNLELTTTPAYASIAQTISQSWTDLGIPTTLKVVAFPDTNDYQVLLIGQQTPKDPDQYSLWHSTQSSNITHYQSPKLEKLLEDGRKELNQEKRRSIYQDFQRFLVEDCPAAFIELVPTYTISRL